jgi:hypothetical protein
MNNNVKKAFELNKLEIGTLVLDRKISMADTSIGPITSFIYF